MKNIIPERFAIVALLSTLSLVVIFHLLILIGIIPFDIVWGGRLKDRSQMLSFEAVSIFTNLVLLVIVAIRAGVIRLNVSPVIVGVAFWLMFALFLLNTIGNLLSTNTFEKIVFTPLTILLSIFSLRLAVTKPAVSTR